MGPHPVVDTQAQTLRPRRQPPSAMRGLVRSSTPKSRRGQSRRVDTDARKESVSSVCSLHIPHGHHKDTMPRSLAIWKELPRDLVEKIVDIAVDMLDDEVGGADGQLACYFFCEVFNRPLPQSMIDYQAMLQETENGYRRDVLGIDTELT
jgi:hypothetical protein